MREQTRAFARPRGQAWGDEAQRAVLHAIAEDVARRSGHRVAAIEALRSDGNLEFVAIAGSPGAEQELLGKAAPLALDRMLAFGEPVEGWVHTLAERVDDETREWMAQYGHTPDVVVSGRQEDWHPEDRLMRLLENDGGELCATLYLDEPLDGRRPTAESIAAINAEIGVMYEAIVSIVERELYREQVVMLAQARAAVASVRPGLGLEDFISEMSAAMVGAMQVDSVDVLLAGESAPSLEPYTRELEDHMRGIWLRRGHLLMEQEMTWGYATDAVPTPQVMADLMRARGLSAWLLVPIGVGEEYLGTMGLGRAEGGSRWIDSEIVAADAVASDLAGVVLDTRLMEQERRTNAELRDLNDDRRTMVRTLAHELRNPLSVLWTHLEMLNPPGGTGPGGVVGESLAAMDRATRRIEDMVEDLMSLAALTDADSSVEHAPVDLSEVVRETAELLATTAPAEEVELVLAVRDGLVVTGERSSLQLLVSNLVSNALKYSSAGGRVSVSLAPDEVAGAGAVRFSCADSGIGIAEPDLEHVFTPFFRSGDREARRRPGTGLGLAIVEGVVDRHGGTIDVQSQLGEGTTFTVRLPLTPPTSARATPADVP